MEMVEDIKQKAKQQKEAVAIFALFTVIQLIIYSTVWNKPMTWDSSIYVAMGKNLFSMGAIGLWEIFRPPVIPVLTGLIWKLGLPIIPASRLLHLIITIAGTGVIYHQLKQIFDYRTALYTVSIILATPVFIENTTNLLTGIISAILVAISLNMYLKKQEYASGTLSGLAFLTRFPAILIAPGIALYEAVLNYRQPREALIRLVKYAVPVAVLMAIYFGLNQIFFGNAFAPITSGLSVPPSDATSLFGTYYFSNLLDNPLTLLAIPGAYLILRDRVENLYPYISVLAVFFVFFELYPHKEVRYALVFLPFIAVSSAYMLKTVEERFSLRKEVFVALAAIIMIVSAVPAYNAASYSNPETEEFYMQFEDLNGTIATNTPGPIQYGDFDYQALPQGYLDSIFGSPEIDYYGINSCAWYDTTGEAGEEIEQLNANLSQYESIYNNDAKNCNYTIYRVQNE